AKLRVQYEARGKWLEDTFLPHAVALIKLSAEQKVDLWSYRGSASGAMGMPQFLPEHHSTFGVDGDGDGKINLFDPADAIFSTANFLKAHGWKTSVLATKQQRSVIWEYNRSVPYVDTVLGMAGSLRTQVRSKKDPHS